MNNQNEVNDNSMWPSFGEYLLMNNLPKRWPTTGKRVIGIWERGLGMGWGLAATWGWWPAMALWVMVAPVQPWGWEVGRNFGEACHTLYGQNCVPPNS